MKINRFQLLLLLVLVALPPLSLQARHKERLHFEVQGVAFDMVLVEGGTFTMGATAEQTGYSDDEHPLHEVHLADYYIGETEVTQELWTAIMGYNESKFKDSPQQPVENVAWNEVEAFLVHLNRLCNGNFALPTEAQWEYAARGGRLARDCRYAGSDNADDVAWTSAAERVEVQHFADTIHLGTLVNNSRAHTIPVAQKLPNELGLYDMSGNVSEWTSTYYAPYNTKKTKNPKGPRKGDAYVVRGGCWYYGPYMARVSCRQKGYPTWRYINVGFRLVLPTWSDVVPLLGSDKVVVNEGR